MAGGKMSARQKMINLMYLVFIAMLALNMSKEVLSAFGFMNEKLVENNTSTTEKNALAYENLRTKASEQPEKFGPLKEKADKVKEHSLDFYQFLAGLKTSMTEKIEVKDDYETMDKTDWLDAYFFKGDNYTAEGQEFLDKINNYRTNVIKVLGSDSKFVPVLNSRFSTSDVIDDETDKSVPFLRARYEGFPMIASLTNFTQIQADIKNTESDIISDLLGGQLESEVSMSNYNGVVQLDKNAFYPGDKVTGSVVLGRYDPSLKPSRVELNGKKYDNFKDGSVILDLNAGSVGEKDIKGTIYFMENGEEVPVPFKSSYSVISKPNAPVVSADKMNVVYRGLPNPISISLPGVPDKDVRASAPGLQKTGSGKYIMNPKAGNTVNISVSAKLADGKNVSTNTPFRIKDIPAAMGTVRGQYGTVRMPKSGLANTPVGAGLPDFLFDLDLQVTSFKVKVPGQLAIIVSGTKFNASAKKALSKARRGDIITIYDIKAVIKNNSYKLKKVLPVNIELTN
ncbi:gliding motility protein GldM [Polaribacter sp. ALD11]|uniref:type IX secretion system motor protein PorM/GldM n=1 Tax=Polaribacter sp. ALD11 TaxID=2058137 RepID=UPI000C306631|nr:gliding motility protein GldM [Polaribacter sp. ALD11]AUC86135.1 gliding motility protein GldM [Polaribacter sp. ALD11]